MYQTYMPQQAYSNVPPQVYSNVPPPQVYSNVYSNGPQVYPASYYPQQQVPIMGYDPSLGGRLRRFFGFAPHNGVRYRHSYGTWGFMGYSRRQRYIDPRTGGEVDRKGRPVYRI